MISYHMIWYDNIWYDSIWNDIIWYDIIRYDKIWYVMIRHDMLWWHMVQKNSNFTFFSKLFGHVGDMFGYHHWSFWGRQKIEKNEMLLFPKVVYWPLGYDLASSLIIFSPEINIFENLKKYFSKFIFWDIYFLFSSIFKDK